ncbi:MAG: ABC transporter permease [Lachnospiraceae bacterium]|nr:ABC transporter permease [Lachnospiraceae bacterium]
MKMCAGLTKRNLLVYFKDKQSIVFSLLTSIIVFALYLLFLKGTFVDAIDGVLDGVTILKERIDPSDIDTLVSMILLTGIVGSAMITVPFNCLTTVISDRENGVDRDILATPIKRWQIVLSYFMASSICAMIMNALILTIGLAALNISGDLHMGVADIASAYGVVALGCMSSTAIFMIVVPFFKSASAGGAFFGMLSAISGFVIGAYIPISQFSKKVQTVCNLFPGSHITIMLRNAVMNGVLSHIDEAIGGVDNGMFVDSIREIFTFKAMLFDNSLGIESMLVYILSVLAVSILAMILLYSKKFSR